MSRANTSGTSDTNNINGAVNGVNSNSDERTSSEPRTNSVGNDSAANTKSDINSKLLVVGSESHKNKTSSNSSVHSKLSTSTNVVGSNNTLSSTSVSSNSSSHPDTLATCGEGEDAVTLHGQQYVVVGVGVVVVRLMVEYAECASTLHMAAQSLLSGLADLLRRFNSDTCR